ncbi:MAG: ribbon-helix-helix domain-containing protein [Actinobacteria bacterium]|nr:ribbon-helix-helix domain-containing protein [Actinomycetota bacterium]
MPTLTRRLQVLLDDERVERLQRHADQRGTSVAALIRDAIDLAYPRRQDDRRRAAEEFLAAEPMPVDDWAVMKQVDRSSLLDRT